MNDLEREICEFTKARNWHRLWPSDVAKSISIEAAELLEIFQWANLTIAKTRKDKIKMQKIQDELADVLIYCIEMSVSLGFDTKQIIRDKLARADKKYPAELMRKNNNRRSAQGEKVYLGIKERHRRGNARTAVRKKKSK